MRDLGSGYITVDPRIPLSPRSHRRPVPRPNSESAAIPRDPAQQSLPHPDDPDLIGTEQSHNQSSAAPSQPAPSAPLLTCRRSP